jgi:hypothetical protein
MTLAPRWRPLWVLPALVVLNGLSPYLGLKTETSWAMYSNLRTELPSNHVFMPEWLKMAGYQEDLVEIVETSLPELQRYREERLLLNAVELRRISGAATADFTVTYKRNGTVQFLTSEGGVLSGADTIAPLGWTTATLLRFRPVDSAGPTKCRH